MCKQAEETQIHVLEECPEIHSGENDKVPKHQIFSEDTGTLRKVADRIAAVLQKMSEVVY